MKFDSRAQKRFGLTDTEVDTTNNNKSSPWFDDYKRREERKQKAKEVKKCK